VDPEVDQYSDGSQLEVMEKLTLMGVEGSRERDDARRRKRGGGVVT